MTRSNRLSLNFATNLKLLRKMQGLTQQDLADALEIKRSAISTYESGFTEPRLTILHKMAQYFDVSMEQLITSPPELIGLEQILPEVKSIEDQGLFVLQLKDFLNATSETQKIYEGFMAFDLLTKKSDQSPAENYEANRLKLILKEILDNNWTILKEIQMLEP